MDNQHSSFIGSIPENYDRYLGPFLFEPYAIDMVSRIDASSAQKVLEIACGTGRVTQHLIEKLSPDSNLIATDLNEEMIAVAKSKVTSNNIEWRTADAQELPFDDNTFDLVVCQFGYMFVPDKAKAFQEAFRVLKIEGNLLFNTWDKIESITAASICSQVVTAFFDNNPPTFYHVPFSMHNENELREYMLNAGFDRISIKEVQKEGSSDSAFNIAKGFIEGNPIYLELLEKDASAIPVLIERIEKEIRAKCGDHPVHSPLNAYVVSAYK
jgi:ubiquinone/menaquinone biosynthesis C-methylase UbiE